MSAESGCVSRPRASEFVVLRWGSIGGWAREPASSSPWSPFLRDVTRAGAWPEITRPSFGSLAVHDLDHAWVVAFPEDPCVIGLGGLAPCAISIFRTADAGATFAKWEGHATGMQDGLGLDVIDAKHIVFWIQGTLNGKAV